MRGTQREAEAPLAHTSMLSEGYAAGQLPTPAAVSARGPADPPAAAGDAPPSGQHSVRSLSALALVDCTAASPYVGWANSVTRHGGQGAAASAEWLAAGAPSSQCCCVVAMRAPNAAGQQTADHVQLGRVELAPALRSAHLSFPYNMMLLRLLEFSSI